MKPTVGLIWAQAENGVIGAGGALPWSLPDDLARFKRVTLGSTVVMGRRTWDSLPRKPLPGRPNVVVTRSPAFHAAGAATAASLPDALSRSVTDRVVCIGGTELFGHAHPFAAVLEMTLVHAMLEGDARMPAIEWGRWHLDSEEFHPADDRHAHDFTFKRFVRRRWWRWWRRSKSLRSPGPSVGSAP